MNIRGLIARREAECARWRPLDSFFRLLVSRVPATARSWLPVVRAIIKSRGIITEECIPCRLLVLGHSNRNPPQIWATSEAIPEIRRKLTEAFRLIGSGAGHRGCTTTPALELFTRTPGGGR